LHPPLLSSIPPSSSPLLSSPLLSPFTSYRFSQFTPSFWPFPGLTHPLCLSIPVPLPHQSIPHYPSPLLSSPKSIHLTLPISSPLLSLSLSLYGLSGLISLPFSSSPF